MKNFWSTFFFFFAQRNISEHDEQNDVGQKKFDLLWNFNVTACARNFTKFPEILSKDADCPYVYMFQISAQSDKSDFCRFWKFFDLRVITRRAHAEIAKLAAIQMRPSFSHNLKLIPAPQIYSAGW